MDDHGRATLKALLSIKAKRERSLRLLFATTLQQEADLLSTKGALLDQRQHHWVAWRQACECEQQLSHAQFQGYKSTLASHWEQDLQLNEKLDHVQAEWQQLQIVKSEQASLLRSNLLEQEKLKMILE